MRRILGRPEVWWTPEVISCQYHYKKEAPENLVGTGEEGSRKEEAAEEPTEEASVLKESDQRRSEVSHSVLRAVAGSSPLCSLEPRAHFSLFIFITESEAPFADLQWAVNISQNP